MKQYYLIPKELIDTQIEDYSILAHDKGHRGNYPEMNLCNEFINTLQSLTQQSELVEVMQLDKDKSILNQEFKIEVTEAAKTISIFNWIEKQGFKLIKTITK